MYGHRLVRELLGLLFLFCGLLMLLSLWSYHVGDPTFNQAVSMNASSVQNAAGLFGAYLSGFLVDCFGLGSFLWVVFFLAVGAGLVSRWLVLKWYRWVGYLLLFSCMLVASSVFDISVHGIHGGGLAGQWLSAFSLIFFSPVGSFLLWFFVFLIAMELSFSISWLTLIASFASWVMRKIPSFGTTYDLPVPHLPEALKRLPGLVAGWRRIPDVAKRPRPVLDIVFGRKKDVAETPAPVLEIKTDLPKAPELPGTEPEPVDSGIREEDLSDLLRLVERPETAGGRTGASEPAVATVFVPEPVPAPAAEKAPAQEESEFIFELEEPVETPVSSVAATPSVATGSAPVSPTPSAAVSAVPVSPISSAAVGSAPASPAAEPVVVSPAAFAASSVESTPPASEAPSVAPAAPAAAAPVFSAPAPSVTASAPAAPSFEPAQAPAPAAVPVQTVSPAPFIEPDVPEEDLPPSALAALSASASAVNTDDLPAVVTAAPSPEKQPVSQTQVPGQASPQFFRAAETPAAPHKDAAYASVDSAVAGALAAQKELEAEAAAPAAPAPVLPKRRELQLPPLELLSPLPEEDLASRPDELTLARQGNALITCLKNFNVNATLARITPGPVVTLFEVRPAPGVKATRITNLANDLAMSLKAVSVRMQAPVPGTDTVGVEVPNEKRCTVHFREIVENENFRQAKSLLTVALGKDTGGRPVSADLAKMPHLLVAGATGAGKSVCLNAIILSLLYRARPDEVQMILVDPKRVELSMYADLPHLVHPVVTDMDLTKNALLWAIEEMNRRLSLFSKVKVRNITGYNDRQARLRAEVEAGGPMPVDAETGEPEDLSNMPFLVIIVDELADLMMVKRKEVEGSIVRLAQLARAAGIHLIIATQRPSVDVVTGIIKANFPCRIAFKVTSGQDSRTIIDGAGAEKLLGMGDMLFKPNGGMIQRLHGAFVSDDEVSAVVEFWKKQQPPNYKVDFAEFGNDDADDAEDFGQPASRSNEIVDDPIYAEAVQFVLDNGKVSISLLQRRFRIGFNRAARFVEQMEKDGLLSQADGTRPRSVVHR